jgi:hypothetical protein
MRRTSYTLIVTAQLEASQVELTVLHNRNGSAFFDLTHIHFCVPLRFRSTHRTTRYAPPRKQKLTKQKNEKHSRIHH